MRLISTHCSTPTTRLPPRRSPRSSEGPDPTGQLPTPARWVTFRPAQVGQYSGGAHISRMNAGAIAHLDAARRVSRSRRARRGKWRQRPSVTAPAADLRSRLAPNSRRTAYQAAPRMVSARERGVRPSEAARRAASRPRAHRPPAGVIPRGAVRARRGHERTRGLRSPAISRSHFGAASLPRLGVARPCTASKR